jgi:co-chaperonin GroES (HSP10)
MLVPLYNKILVELIPETPAVKTPGGLFTPEKPTVYCRGKVVSVGKGHYQNAQRIEMDVKIGQVAWFLRASGMGIEFDIGGNPTKILLSDMDIYAVEE